MIQPEVKLDPEDFADLVKRLQKTPTTLVSIVEEFRALSAPARAAGSGVGNNHADGPPANAGGSDKSALQWRNSDGAFSVLENICHLRDIEVEGYAVRINRILCETNPVLLDIDGGRLSVERNYNEQDPDLEVSVFAIARTRNLGMLNGLGAEELNRQGSLEGVGVVTLLRLTEMMLEHDESHLQDLRSLWHELKRLL